jgi:hypothetical protein
MYGFKGHHNRVFVLWTVLISKQVTSLYMFGRFNSWALCGYLAFAYGWRFWGGGGWNYCVIVKCNSTSYVAMAEICYGIHAVHVVIINT